MSFFFAQRGFKGKINPETQRIVTKILENFPSKGQREVKFCDSFSKTAV